MSLKPKEYISRGFLFWLCGPIKEQDFTFSFDCLLNTAFWLAADKFVFISPSFYLEASVFLKKENDLTWFIYLPWLSRNSFLFLPILWFSAKFFPFWIMFLQKVEGFFLFREDIFWTRTIVFFILFIMLITIVCAMKCFWKNITNKGNLQKGMGSIVVCRLFVFWIIIHNLSIESTNVKVCKCLNPYIMNHLFFIEYRHFLLKFFTCGFMNYLKV